MAGIKIKASGPLALVDRVGGPQVSGNDIAHSLGHSNQASGEVRLSHFFAGYGNLGLGTTGFGDGYKLWQSAASERGTVPSIESRSPAEIEAAGDDVPELKFSDFYNVRQQDTAIGVSKFTAATDSVTNTEMYGFSLNNSHVSGSFGSGDTSTYNFNFRETICGINGATTAGWKVTGFYATQTPYSATERNYEQYLHMQWDAGSGTVPTRSNSGWTRMDVGTWDNSTRNPDGLPTLTRSAQMTRTGCTFVANHATGQSYWRQSYGTGNPTTVTGGAALTIYQYYTLGAISWHLVLIQ